MSMFIHLCVAWGSADSDWSQEGSTPRYKLGPDLFCVFLTLFRQSSQPVDRKNLNHISDSDDRGPWHICILYLNSVLQHYFGQSRSDIRPYNSFLLMRLTNYHKLRGLK